MPPLHRMPLSMSRSQPQHHHQYLPPAPHHHQSTLSALASPFRPPSQPVSVVVKNTAGAADDTADSSERVSDEGQIRHDSGPRDVGLIAERDLYYMPMPLGSSRAEENARGAMISAANMTAAGARGTKRPHEGEGDLDGDTPRKHGKRLTTKEEVSLFEICNRHATSFGHRSNLCNWWKTVTAEFTRAHGHPYSWHSVRRKVELVTKQRMKFLEDQLSRPGSSVSAEDLSNLQWRTAVDAWIPTWRRWEDAEARRIEKRDSRRSRKRKESQSWDPWATADADGWRFPPASSLSPVVGPALQATGSNTVGDVMPATAASGPATATAAAAPPPPLPPSSTPTSATVKLPPGFDSMFSNVPSMTQSIPAAPTSSAPATPQDYRMVSAVLKTLGKLNKHLDAASANGGPDPRSSPVISALVSTAESATQNQNQNQNHHPSAQQAAPHHSHAHHDHHHNHQPRSPSPSSSHIPKAIDIESLKEELRQEIHAEVRRELERDRVALEEKLNSVQRTQEMILDMLSQEPA